VKRSGISYLSVQIRCALQKFVLLNLRQSGFLFETRAFAERPAGAASTKELYRNVMLIATEAKLARPRLALGNHMMMVNYF
jgi:hypothetical protein